LLISYPIISGTSCQAWSLELIPDPRSTREY